MNKGAGKYWLLLIVSLLIVIIGSGLGSWINSGAGTVEIKNVRWAGTNAFVYNARLYVPKGVTNENPAPGALVVHGGDAQNEIMANVALELARRGIVTLAIDQPGAGFSDPPSFAMGAGGADSLRYLRSLDIVDQENIGLIGMSMGGGAVGSAVTAFPDGYKSIVCLHTRVTSGPGQSLDTPLRNILVLFGYYEEHTPFFWQVAFPQDLPESTLLQNQLGVSGRVEPGKLYGSVEDGTAAMLRITPNTHLTNMDSRASIGSIIEWFQLTLANVKNIPPSKQIWPWKVLGTFMAIVGMVLFVFPLGALLLRTDYFKSLAEPVPEYKGFTGWRWWIAAIITTALIPVIYVLSRQYIGNLSFLLPSGLWPQSQINRYYLPLAVVLAIVSVVLVLINHFAWTRKQGATAVNYGLTWENRGIDWGKIGKSFLLAICIFVPTYLIVSTVYNVFNVDLRLNFYTIRPMSLLHFRCFLGYVILFILSYLVLAVVLHGFLRFNKNVSMGWEMVTNVAILLVGMIVWMAIQYISTFNLGAPILGSDTNLTIRAFPLLINWIILALMSTYFFRKTGRVYVSGFLMGLFITWFVAASSMISVVL